MPTVEPMSKDTSNITRGNVCVDEKGQLFVALNIYNLRPNTLGPNGWYGMGFNGEQVYAMHCSFVAANINEYMRLTYGTDYSAEIQSE